MRLDEFIDGECDAWQRQRECRTIIGRVLEKNLQIDNNKTITNFPLVNLMSIVIR